jgi:hypothetical protein
MFVMESAFGMVFLAALMAVVSSEVYAALHGAHYAVKDGGGWRVAVARYQWASPLWHEVAQREQGNSPAYRASRVVGVLGAAAAVLAFTGASFYVAAGAAVLVAASFGAAAYGQAFVMHRATVQEEILAWREATA